MDQPPRLNQPRDAREDFNQLQATRNTQEPCPVAGAVALLRPLGDTRNHSSVRQADFRTSTAPAASFATTVPDAMCADAIVPAAIVPDAIVPAAIVPDAIVPAAIVPDAIVPAAIVPDAIVPAAIALEPIRNVSTIFAVSVASVSWPRNALAAASWTSFATTEENPLCARNARLSIPLRLFNSARNAPSVARRLIRSSACPPAILASRFDTKPMMFRQPGKLQRPTKQRHAEKFSRRKSYAACAKADSLISG
jgi:hypothetical protein